MGLKMTVNAALSVSLGLLFLLLVGCALAFLAGVVRVAREGSRGRGRTWMAYSLGAGLLLLAVTPLLRPGLGILTRWASPANNSIVTVEKYRAIRAGMTYDDVQRVLGMEGVEFTRNEQAGYSMAIYQWDNTDGSIVQVTLNNGIVSGKSQMGLSR